MGRGLAPGGVCGVSAGFFWSAAGSVAGADDGSVDGAVEDGVGGGRPRTTRP